MPTDDQNVTNEQANVPVEDLRSNTLDERTAATVKGGIGSATTGAGSGKVSFSEFTIKKTTDSSSPL